MLIDWLSMVYDVQTDDDRLLVDRLSEGRDVCVRLSHGQVKTEWFPRESKRSDSHQISFGLTRNRITIDGSPARLQGDNNVFGSGDPKHCGELMRRAVSTAAGVVLPPLNRWRFTRVDLTQNHDCGSALNVRAALQSLASVSGGRLKASSFSDTVYWNKTSDLWRAKAYHKGPHLAHQVKCGKAGADPDQLNLSNRLLRLEVSLCNRLIKRACLNWDTLTEEKAMELFKEVAEKLIPPNACEITSEQQIAEALLSAYGTKLGRRLMGTWGQIKTLGLAATQESMSRATWFRHQAAFQSIGLSFGDLQTGTVLAFRPKSIVSRPVDSWEDLRRAA